MVAGLLRRLWVEPPPGYRFRPLSEMCDYWAGRYEQRSPAERSCVDAPVAEQGIRLLRDLPRTGGDGLLLHTDLHAGNVLAADANRGWPSTRSLTGDPAYDVTQHIFNGVFIEGADIGSSPPGWRACSIWISAGSGGGCLPGPSRRHPTGPEWRT